MITTEQAPTQQQAQDWTISFSDWKPGITKKDFLKELSHKYGGNGFAVVQFLKDEMCYVADLASLAPNKEWRVFAVWQNILGPTIWIDKKRNKTESSVDPEEAAILQRIQADLASGKCVVKNSRLKYI